MVFGMDTKLFKRNFTRNAVQLRAATASNRVFLIFRDFLLLFAGLLVDPLVPALRERVDDRQDEVDNHSYHEELKDPAQQVAFVLLRLAAMELLFLVCEEGLEGLLHLLSDDGNECYQINGFIDQLLAERHDDDDLLEMHFNHSLADKRRAEKRPEWHKEMAARDAGEVEEGIRNLKSAKMVISHANFSR